MKMLTAVALLSIPWMGACATNDDHKVQIRKEPVRLLNVAKPQEFLINNFANYPPTLPLTVASIDEQGFIVIENQDRAIRFAYELVTASQHGDTVSIGINSRPMALEEVVQLSKEVCDVTGMSDANITAWVSAKRHESAVDASCLQTGRIGEVDHSIELRKSHEEAKPWRTIYEISFSGTLP